MRRVLTSVPALLCAAGCLALAAPALAQEAAPARVGQTMGMRYLSWSGKPTRAVQPVAAIVEAEPAPPPAPAPSTVDQPPLRAALPAVNPLDAARRRRPGPIIPRRPIMTLPAPAVIAPEPAPPPSPSQGLTPADTWASNTAPAYEAYEPPASVPSPYGEAVVRPYYQPGSVPAETAYTPPPTEAPPAAPLSEPPRYEAPPVESPPAYEPPPAPVIEAAVPPVEPAPVPPVDPMAPRPDAPVFRMNREAPPVEDAPPAEPAPEAPPAETAPAPVDPMAPRPDAPVFRLRPQPSPVAASDAGPADAPTSEGARYYSVHRQAGHRPDATPLPQGVFLDTLPVDLAEPPPPPAVTRDRDGRVRAVVPNEDPSLP